MIDTTTLDVDLLTPRLCIPSGDQLGESVTYDSAQKTLYWVDITGSRISISGTENRRTIDLQIQPGFVVLLESGELFAGGNQQLMLPENQNLNPVLVPECETGAVVNDGMVSPDGRCLVFGSRDEKEEQALGRMIVVTRSETIVYPDKYTVFNGPAFSPCGQILYFTDSPTGVIWQADFDTTTGRMDERKVFATVPPEQGLPDGMCTDDEGCLWSAHWDGACLTRYRADGSVDLKVPMPVTRPTSVAFGGPQRNTLYITSAMPDNQALRPDTDGITDGDLLSMVLPVTGPVAARLSFNPLDVIRNGKIGTLP